MCVCVCDLLLTVQTSSFHIVTWNVTVNSVGERVKQNLTNKNWKKKITKELY